MGRYSTGARTTASINRIELKLLLRDGLILDGRKIRCTLSWTDGNCITLESHYLSGQGFIRLIYTNTSSDGIKTEYDYKISLISLPSNLGKGRVPYFLCPDTNKRCRVLYLCYGAQVWKSRTAYNKRIYYESQICSKLDYHNTRYWTIDSQLQKMNMPKKKHYKGKETKAQKRRSELINKLCWHDERRWLSIPKRVQAIMNKEGLKAF